MNYHIRNADSKDAQSIVRVQQASRAYDFGSTSYGEENLQRAWDGLDVGADAWVAVDGDGQIAGYADLPASSDNEFWIDLQVAPEHRGKGIEEDILRRIMARAIEREGPSHEKRAILYGRMGDANQAAREAFERVDFEWNLTFQIMQVELDGEPEAPIMSEGIEIRQFQAGLDDQAAYQADEESAEDKGYHTPLSFEGWRKRMGMDKEGFDPSLWFLAWDGDDVAAVCLNYIEGESIGWVDHLGVRRKWRKQGLGMSLLRHSFGEFYRRGIRTAKLIVDSGSLTNAPRLYEAAGLRVVMKYHIYKKALA